MHVLPISRQKEQLPETTIPSTSKIIEAKIEHQQHFF